MLVSTSMLTDVFERVFEGYTRLISYKRKNVDIVFVNNRLLDDSDMVVVDVVVGDTKEAE